MPVFPKEIRALFPSPLGERQGEGLVPQARSGRVAALSAPCVIPAKAGTQTASPFASWTAWKNRIPQPNLRLDPGLRRDDAVGMAGIIVLLLTLFTSPALANEPQMSAQETIGGLTCFTVTPDLPKNYDPTKAKSCKALCADQGAACSGVTSNIGPIPSCEESAAPNSMVCRCCKVAK